MIRRILSTSFAAIVLLGGLSGARTQDAPSSTPSGPANPSGTTSPIPGSAAQPPTADPGAAEAADTPGGPKAEDSDTDGPDKKRSWSAQVRVVDGVTEEPIARKAVFLKVARAQGPFQRRSPKPVDSWEAVTDENGVVTFDDLPPKLAGRGLEVYAITTSSGIEFESKRRSARDGAELEVPIYPRANDAEDLVVEQLRTVLEPWEDFVVVTQHWRLRVSGKRAIDTTSLSGERFEHGLPLQLPLEAKGIHLSGPGSSKIIDSTANWKGVLQPNNTVRLRLRFSISASSPTLVYRQTLDYPVENTEVVVPLQTKYPKVPRLENAELAAKGFESVEATTDVPGFRDDNEYLYASGKSLQPGESFAVKVEGLPFERPTAPWVALGLGVFGIGLILLYARREIQRMESSEGVDDALGALEQEREELLDELAELERAYEAGDITEITYETESLHLRERLSLIMKKIDELRDS